jgi:hypothetical protein
MADSDRLNQRRQSNRGDGRNRSKWGRRRTGGRPIQARQGKPRGEDRRRQGKTDGGRGRKTDGGQARVARVGERQNLGSDTMLGISNLHYQGAKGHIYSTCTGRKYAGNPLTDGENIIYNIHLTTTCTAVQEWRPPKACPLKFCTMRRAIRFLG